MIAMLPALTHKGMPPDAHLHFPLKRDNHLIEECDEILRRGCPSPEVTDAWLDERLSCMRLRASEKMRAAIGEPEGF